VRLQLHKIHRELGKHKRAHRGTFRPAKYSTESADKWRTITDETPVPPRDPPNAQKIGNLRTSGQVRVFFVEAFRGLTFNDAFERGLYEWPNANLDLIPLLYLIDFSSWSEKFADSEEESQSDENAMDMDRNWAEKGRSNKCMFLENGNSNLT